MQANQPALPLPYRIAEAAPYWEGTKDGKLKLQYCQQCNLARFYPRHLCPACGSSAVSWRDACGNGSVYSYTVVHRGPTAAFKDRQPYVVALIDLAEGPRMMSNIVGEAALQVKIGDPVRVLFEDRGEYSLPVFERVV